jgi:hypothetical protein
VRGTLVDRCDRCGAVLRRMEQAQHAAVESVYEDLACQLDYPPESGQMWDTWSWHQIMIGLFAEEQGWELPKFVPTPRGAVIPVMRQKQSRLTKRQGSDLIEFAKAYGLNRGAVVREWDEQGNLIAGGELNALRAA